MPLGQPLSGCAIASRRTISRCVVRAHAIGSVASPRMITAATGAANRRRSIRCQCSSTGAMRRSPHPHNRDGPHLLVGLDAHVRAGTPVPAANSAWGQVGRGPSLREAQGWFGLRGTVRDRGEKGLIILVRGVFSRVRGGVRATRGSCRWVCTWGGGTFRLPSPLGRCV
jgi:hypothetical protein